MGAAPLALGREIAAHDTPDARARSGRGREDATKPDERVSMVDWIMLALAVASLAMLVVEEAFFEFFAANPRYAEWLVAADVAVCGVFAVELLARMRRAPDRWAYVKSRWYDVVGMIPVSHPLFRSFRLVRLLRIAVISSRFVRATNRGFGEMAFEAVVRRFSDILVEVVADAVVLRSLDTIEPWLLRARFAERIGDAMDLRRDEVRSLVHEALRRAPGGTLAVRLPGLRGAAEALEEAATSAAIETLKSDELNAVVQEATREILAELKQQVAVREYQTRRRPGEVEAS